MASSKDLFTRAKKIIPSGINSPVRYYDPYPFFVKKAKGSVMWDVDGNNYLDYCNAYGALLLGHRRKEIISDVSKQMDKGTLYCAPTEIEVNLSELISGNFPSMEKVRLVNTGSEATMTAIRLARGFTKKKKIIKFEGCYHGAHDYVLVKAGSGAAHIGMPVSEGSLDEVSRNTLVVQYNNSEELQSLLEKEDDVAAVIVEPVLANMGLVLPQKNFLNDLRKITLEKNIVLIFDEVVTGFRMSPGGAQKYYSIKPDVTTLGKALGNGFPIAAVGGKSEIM
ncbi:MAG: glutamate-1-semialdehyde 2,1-aminomutase, partial [Candidatus Nitrosotalea sp.]|nr:glutamate-1-semialdehyde 2,1-aminomutase [Candidatus Nitrosotalea sp.]